MTITYRGGFWSPSGYKNFIFEDAIDYSQHTPLSRYYFNQAINSDILNGRPSSDLAKKVSLKELFDHAELDVPESLYDISEDVIDDSISARVRYVRKRHFALTTKVEDRSDDPDVIGLWPGMLNVIRFWQDDDEKEVSYNRYLMNKYKKVIKRRLFYDRIRNMG